MVDEIGFYSRNEVYGWLSNFHRSTMTIDGKNYPTSEHYYQSQKASGSIFQEWIRCAPNPYLAMKAGQSLRADKLGELRQDWELVKLSIMLKGLRHKFQNLDLRRKLLETNDTYLYENSPNDTYWGLVNHEGSNHLGILIMQVRRELQHVP